MTKFIIKRLIQGIPTLFGITILSFGIMSAAPGGPTAALNFSPNSTQEQQEQLRERFGIDDPVYVQYARWMVGDLIEGGEIYGKGILRGDFGRSFSLKKPVNDVIAEKIPATLELTGISLIVGLLIGMPAGILSAVWQGSIFDQFTRVFSVIAQAIPGFWLGLMLILIFGGSRDWSLDLLPMGNQCNLTDTEVILSGKCPPLYERLDYLVLPVFVLATGWIALFSRFMRASVLDVLNQDYVRTARAKGLHANRVWFVHATRNALIPIATFLGPAIPGLLSGAVITEQVFSWPGLGRTFLSAVNQQDFPIVMASALIGGVGTVVGYLLSDILYAFIDPRIRLG